MANCAARCVAVAGELGISENAAAIPLDELLRDIRPAAEALVGPFDTGTSPVRHAGEHRRIRMIVSDVLREMCAQLA